MSRQVCLIFTVCDQYPSFLLLPAGGLDTESSQGMLILPCVWLKNYYQIDFV